MDFLDFLGLKCGFFGLFGLRLRCGFFGQFVFGLENDVDFLDTKRAVSQVDMPKQVQSYF